MGVNHFGSLFSRPEKKGTESAGILVGRGKRATGWKSDQEIVCLTLLRLTDSGNDGNETNLSPSPYLVSWQLLILLGGKFRFMNSDEKVIFEAVCRSSKFCSSSLEITDVKKPFAAER